MKFANFDYWMRLREPINMKDIKEYIEDLCSGYITEPIFRKNLNNGITEKFNPKTTFWEQIED